MRRVRFCVAASLDGYLAGPNGEFDWIVTDPDIDFRAFMAEFDTLLMGRKTWEMTRAQGGTGMPGMTVYVFSRTLAQEDCSDGIVSADPAAIVPRLKEQPGKDIWIFGGGSLFGSLLDLGLVDTVEIAVIPVLLGQGVPVLPHAFKPFKLRLVKHRVYEKTGTVRLEYVPA